MINHILKSVAVTSLILGSLQAGEIEVKVVNMTGGSYFTPLLVATHGTASKLYTTGEAASDALQAMAEGGDISKLSTNLQANAATIVENPAEGLLAPGKNSSTTLTTTDTNNRLSIVAMILPSNDAFVALNNWEIPKEKGTYKIQLHAYDAGTEANNEVVNGAGAPGALGVPADPGGNAGTGATGVDAVAEGFVHIHRGILGDDSATGGKSDLDITKHRWLNPVATAIITVK